MLWQETPYTLFLFIGAGVSAFSGVFTWKHVRAAGSRWAALLLLVCSVWATTYALEMASADIAAKVVWNKLEYVGAASLPTVFLLFTLCYTNAGIRLNGRLPLLLAIEPLVTFSLVISNELHGLIWSSHSLDESSSFAVLVNTHGSWFWVHAAYSYTLLLVASVLLVKLLLRAGSIFQRQAAGLLVGVVVPWVANLLFITHLTPFPLLDTTPVAFIVASMAVAWSISGLRFTDIASASRRTAIESMADGVVFLDAANRVLDLNLAFRLLIDQPKAKLIGMPVERLWPDWPDQPKDTTATVDHWSVEASRRTGSRVVTYDLRTSPVVDWRGHLISRVVVIRDVTERKRLEAELAQRYLDARLLADRDSLTGLLNHRAFHERLAKEVKRASRAGQPLSVAMMDVDGFKLFNDTYGHPIGDRALRTVAEVLLRSTRAHDVFGRYGGDEFAAILPETDTQEAIKVAERLRSELRTVPYVAAGGNRVPIRLSFGIATYPNHGQRIDELVGYADANLYESKQLGGDAITSGGDHPEIVKVGTFGVLDGLVTTVDHKDRYTRKHSEDVTEYAMAIARAMGLSEESQRTLRIAGLLHDIGKIGVPDRVLRKPGGLNDEEYEVVKQHVFLGELIIKEVPNQADVISAVGSHHERVDGTGYPRGLRGDNIPILGRILAVADTYSAMTTDRPYRKAMDPSQAGEELLRAAGSQLDPDIVNAFVGLLGERESDRHRQDRCTDPLARPRNPTRPRRCGPRRGRVSVGTRPSERPNHLSA